MARHKSQFVFYLGKGHAVVTRIAALFDIRNLAINVGQDFVDDHRLGVVVFISTNIEDFAAHLFFRCFKHPNDRPGNVAHMAIGTPRILVIDIQRFAFGERGRKLIHRQVKPHAVTKTKRRGDTKHSRDCFRCSPLLQQELFKFDLGFCVDGERLQLRCLICWLVAIPHAVV